MKKPNIFKYATKELSQDAFIFWLLDHANPKYKDVNQNLKKCALNLISEFFKLENKIMPEIFSTFKLKKQYENIDIYLKINNFSIIIEDKTETRAHGNQLVKYKSIIGAKVGEENVLAIYFKTHDQSNYNKELKEGFKIFTRQDLLRVLNTIEESASDIFYDFRSYIQDIEHEVSEFQSIEVSNWEKKNWIGFYKYLQNEFGEGNWDKVNNPGKPFMGFWWSNKSRLGCNHYLQLEEKKFCIKISVDEKSKYSYFRSKSYRYYNIKQTQEEFNINLLKPKKFGAGKHMTILQGNYIEIDILGFIKIDDTIKNLRRYMDYFNAVEISERIK